MLKDDFGKDLLISGGNGNSLGDPIILESSTAHDASWTEMEVTRCIYSQLKWHWKLIDRVPVKNEGMSIEKFSCEVKHAEGEEVITEKRNFYFDVSKINLEGSLTTPVCGVNLGLGTGMGLPYQLGWFHFDGLINHEENYAGAGVSAAYSAPFTKATLYFYKNGETNIDGVKYPEVFEKEFAISSRDLLEANPQAEELASRSTPNLCFKSFQIDSAYSILIFSTVGNHFFKLRATIDPSNEKYTMDCFWESVNIIVGMVTKPS